jgi:hypothetical protein
LIISQIVVAIAPFEGPEMKRYYILLLGLLGCVDQGHKRTLESDLKVMVEERDAERESTDPFPPQEVLRKITPNQVWTGTNGARHQQSFEICRDAAAFEECWRKNFQRNFNDVIPTCPSVRFETDMVAVIYHGKEAQNRGIQFLQIQEEPEWIRIRYRPLYYQCANVPDYEEKYGTRSYGIAVIPHSDKAVVFEEDVHSNMGAPPEWKRRAMIAGSTSNGVHPDSVNRPMPKRQD